MIQLQISTKDPQLALSLMRLFWSCHVDVKVVHNDGTITNLRRSQDGCLIGEHTREAFREVQDQCPACRKTTEEKCYFEWCVHPPHYQQ